MLIRKVAIIFLPLLCILLIVSMNQHRILAEQAHHSLAGLDRVAVLAHTVEKHRARVVAWSVYGRETGDSEMTREEFEQAVKQAKKQLQDKYVWQWLKQHDGVVGWKGTAKAGSSSLQTDIRLLAYPDGSKYRMDTLYHAAGSKYSDSGWHKAERSIRKEMKRIFSGQEHIYSCVKADYGAKIKFGLIKEGKRYLKDFSATAVEQLQEKTFVSISAYTTAWNDTIDTGNKKMNIQAALREDGGRTTIILGSPIITVEY